MPAPRLELIKLRDKPLVWREKILRWYEKGAGHTNAAAEAGGVSTRTLLRYISELDKRREEGQKLLAQEIAERWPAPRRHPAKAPA
jgi:hypothetical protein